MIITRITDETFLLYAMNHYSMPISDVGEFEEDVQRIKYLKKLLMRYDTDGELKTRLIINHLVILYNTFNPPIAATRMLAFRLPEHLDVLKEFLDYLGYWPTKIDGVGVATIYSENILGDVYVKESLRQEFGERP